MRGGNAGAGGPIAGITGNQLKFFNEALDTFNEVDDVGAGLGPRFNMDSCAGCHAQPAPGGSSPAANVGVKQANPQIAVASRAGADNVIPSFITANGPVREARFVNNPDGTPDGGVHDLFTIVGRADAPTGCTNRNLPQPNFAQQLRNNNVIFRIPTPTFGAGLMSTIRDDTLISNLAADGSRKSALGISGRLNREGNAGTISRFGWKAQNKSLAIFAGEAYLVEQGVSNELFPQERGEPGDRGVQGQRSEPPLDCLTNGNPQGSPEDNTHFDEATPEGAGGDTAQFATFSEFLAPPAPVAFNRSAQNGQSLFTQVGCNLCHTPTMTTGTSRVAALSRVDANLYSDLAIHDMGTGLQDRVSQGAANGREFRTAPLWGVGQRVFFLHDGRTSDLLAAIKAHSSNGSEANGVINNFNNLSQLAQQDLLNFLRSL